MKIAIIVSGGVDRSGTRRVVPCLLWLIEGLVRAGDEVHVFAVCQEPVPGTWSLLGAKIHNAGNSRARLLGQFVGEHFRGRFDVTHTMWSAPANLAALLAKWLLRVPMLLYFGGGELFCLPEIGYGSLRNSRGRIFLRLCVIGASFVAAQSVPMVARAATLNILASRLPLGVALDRWPPAAFRRRDPSEPARLLQVGSLNGVKDHVMMLAAASALKRRGVSFTVDVVGADVFGDERVQRMAKDLGLADKVLFHGCLSHCELRPLFDRADFLLVTSRQEAGPLVALEAAVACVPVVGTNVGHLSEWAPSAAGVVQIGDGEGLALEIMRLLADEDARMIMAEEAQKRAMAENADMTTARFRQIYAKLAKREGRNDHL